MHTACAPWGGMIGLHGVEAGCCVVADCALAAAMLGCTRSVEQPV